MEVYLPNTGLDVVIRGPRSDGRTFWFWILGTRSGLFLISTSSSPYTSICIPFFPSSILIHVNNDDRDDDGDRKSSMTPALIVALSRPPRRRSILSLLSRPVGSFSPSRTARREDSSPHFLPTSSLSRSCLSADTGQQKAGCLPYHLIRVPCLKKCMSTVTPNRVFSRSFPYLSLVYQDVNSGYLYRYLLEFTIQQLLGLDERGVVWSFCLA